MMLDNNYKQLKNEVIKAERRVLKELGFCVHVKHPHKLIVMYLQVLGFEKHQNLMQLSWNYMNDSLRTDVFVRYQPETVACACIYLTARQLGIPLPRAPSWFSVFRVEETDIQDICFRILRLYTRPKPNSEELERKVNELKSQYQEARLKAKGNNTTASAGSNSPASPSQNKTRHASPRWGGFISRNNHGAEKHRSGSRSPSPSPPPVKHNKKSKKNRSLSQSRSRSRSRSHERRSKKYTKRRSYSRSPSLSPPKIQRKNKEKSRHRSRSRSHDRRTDSYDRYYCSSKSRSRHTSRERVDRKDRR